MEYVRQLAQLDHVRNNLGGQNGALLVEVPALHLWTLPPPGCYGAARFSGTDPPFATGIS
jgi:hypothetical protein